MPFRSFLTPYRMQLLPAALLAAGLVLLAACTTATPYQPAAGNGYGFSDRRLEDNRFLVAFDGNSLTPKEDVELYLLYRSAQITLQTGNDFFVLVQRDTEADTRYVDNTTVYGPPYGQCWGGWGWGGWGWGPRWGWGPAWRGWGYGCGGPTFATTSTYPVTRYSAQAEILVYPGRTPDGDPNAYDAREIVANVGPYLKLPPA